MGVIGSVDEVCGDRVHCSTMQTTTTTKTWSAVISVVLQRNNSTGLFELIVYCADETSAGQLRHRLHHDAGCPDGGHRMAQGPGLGACRPLGRGRCPEATPTRRCAPSSRPSDTLTEPPTRMATATSTPSHARRPRRTRRPQQPPPLVPLYDGDSQALLRQVRRDHDIRHQPQADDLVAAFLDEVGLVPGAVCLTEEVRSVFASFVKLVATTVIRDANERPRITPRFLDGR